MLKTLDKESNKVGLKMNVTKIKIMTNSARIPTRSKDCNIEYVKSINVYLSKQASFHKVNNKEEIERRLNIMWKKFWSFKEILKGDYSINLKTVFFRLMALFDIFSYLACCTLAKRGF